jgi:hypothetical protein
VFASGAAEEFFSRVSVIVRALTLKMEKQAEKTATFYHPGGFSVKENVGFWKSRPVWEGGFYS